MTPEELAQWLEEEAYKNIQLSFGTVALKPKDKPTDEWMKPWLLTARELQEKMVYKKDLLYVLDERIAQLEHMKEGMPTLIREKVGFGLEELRRIKSHFCEEEGEGKC